MAYHSNSGALQYLIVMPNLKGFAIVDHLINILHEIAGRRALLGQIRVFQKEGPRESGSPLPPEGLLERVELPFVQYHHGLSHRTEWRGKGGSAVKGRNVVSQAICRHDKGLLLGIV